MKCKKCKETAEWIDKYCQFHWEEYCSEAFWEMIDRLDREVES